MALLTVLEKLEIRDEKNILIQGLPSSLEKQFVKIPFSKNVTPLLKSRGIDFALVFAINRTQLTNILKEVIPALAPDANFWIAYPKLASKIASDLTRENNWDCVCNHGFDNESEVVLDGVWSAIRFCKAVVKPVASTKTSKKVLQTV